MNLITNQNDIASASTAQLVATYNALTGKSIKKFETRAIGESKVAMAILASEHEAGKAGVAKGAKPKAAPKADIDKKKGAAAREAKLPPVLDLSKRSKSKAKAEEPQQPEVPAGKPVKSASGLSFPSNSLASQLLTAAAESGEKRAAAKASPRAPSVRRPKGQPERMLVTLTEGNARSKLQSESNRARIVAVLREAKKGAMTVADLVKAMEKKMAAADVDASVTKLSALCWVELSVIEEK